MGVQLPLKQTVLEEMDFDVTDASRLGSDGASVMTGRRDGVELVYEGLIPI